MKLNYITIMVRDLEKSQGDTMLELIQFEQAEEVTSTGMVFSFLAKKPLTELKEQSEVMGYLTSDIVSEPPKPAHFTVTDPDGLVIEISEA